MSDQQRARELRDQGINAMRAGDKAQAQHLLSQAAELDPKDEHTWLWLSGTVNTDDERRFCMQKALEANPNSTVARNALEKLGAAPAAPAAAAYTPPVPTNPEIPPYRVPESSTSAGMSTQVIQPQPDSSAGMSTQRVSPEQANQWGQQQPTAAMSAQPMPAQPGQWGQQPGMPQQWDQQQQQWGQQPMQQQWGQQPGMPPGAYPGMAYGGQGYYVPANATGQRPGCIGCLAALHMAGGAFLFLALLGLGGLLSVIAQEQGVSQDELMAGGILAFISIFMVGFGILSIATGIGLWRGLRWGWWMAVCAQGYNVASGVLGGLLSLAGLEGDSLATSVAAGSTLTSLLVSGGIYYYYFRPEVWAFFGFSPASKTNNAIITLGVGTLFAIIMIGLQAAALGGL